MTDQFKLDESRVSPQELPLLSPSSINLFMVDPALWVLKHFYGARGEFGIYAMRGVAVEDGVNEFFRDESVTICQATAHAVDSFISKSFYLDDEDLSVDIESKIPAWVETSCKALIDIGLGSRPKLQTEIRTEIAGLPIGGFVDYDYETTIVDLKTTNTLPKVLIQGARKGQLPAAKAANVRQQAIYRKATNKKVVLLYTTPDNSYAHHLGEPELKAAEKSMEPVCERIKNLLTSDIEDVISNTIPDWDSMNRSFYWDDELKELAHDIWGDFTE